MAADKQNDSRTVSMADENAVKDILVRSVFGLWDVVNELTRLRPSKRERYRVTIFGSARAAPGTFVYDEVKRVARALGELDCDIITGGGPGLMQAANEGAAASDAHKSHQSVGIRVELPFEQQVNPFVTEAFEHKTFFTRLHHFVLTSDAFVVAPGGIGTVLELIWARVHLLNVEPPLASAADMSIPRCVNTADEAIAVIQEHHAAWLRETKNC